ncbi:hypothetical protein ASE16_00720 [Leifsonia sp. Root227]|uniref:hypothetical protein n=1 Tax=Leifsonia sp. Root227 TaxID=1736496 RepID=UPI000700DC3A|nr:hypothetical protein [Leifsonia sp. Root227]KRC51652.1 hypothetical protein ASE16_00720 [Leifsonia sp. Root227]
MTDNRQGRHAFDASVAASELEQTPLVGIGRQELRNGKLLLWLGVVILPVGIALHFARWDAGAWDDFVRFLTTAVFVGAGVSLGQGIRLYREGRATLRDEARRQAENKAL